MITGLTRAIWTNVVLASGAVLTALTGFVVGYGSIWFQIGGRPDAEDYQVSAGGYAAAAVVLVAAIPAVIAFRGAEVLAGRDRSGGSALSAARGAIGPPGSRGRRPRAWDQHGARRHRGSPRDAVGMATRGPRGRRVGPPAPAAGYSPVAVGLLPQACSTSRPSTWLAQPQPPVAQEIDRAARVRTVPAPRPARTMGCRGSMTMKARASPTPTIPTGSTWWMRPNVVITPPRNAPTKRRRLPRLTGGTCDVTGGSTRDPRGWSRG